METFRALETAAYCPRKLYYRRREGRSETPDRVAEVRSLAFEYGRLLADDAALLAAPIETDPATYRERLRTAREDLDVWETLVDPPHRDVHLEGRDVRGVAHKVLEAPLAPTVAFAGAPPEQGVWEPQSVRLVAAAKALAWERECRVERAYAEYPAHGVVRPIELTVRRTAAYRRALTTAAGIDGPPSRIENDAKCEPCEFAAECGVRTRSAASLLQS